MFQAKDVEPGIAALERAHVLAPGRGDVLLVLGGLQLVAHRVDGARASFAAVARSTSEPRERRQAEEGLAEVAVAQAFEAARTTHDVVSAAAAIRSALPDLDLRRHTAAGSIFHGS